MLKRLTKRNPEKRRYYKKMPDGAGAYPAYKQYSSVGRISASAIRQSQNSTRRRPDKTLRVAIRQSQNSTRP
ncbi:hypothetical protein SEER0660_02719 [Salmonella enterica subsp. enterica serovar Muenster str. 660]|nr:hypothetical protein SEER0660_02719 [Salmonella enterica subsp. enterica serovar Muenster str. 660]